MKIGCLHFVCMEIGCLDMCVLRFVIEILSL